MKINDLFEGKGTKEQAGYIPRPKNGEKCINCTMWRDPNKCSAVAGDISPNGWCEWYAGGAYGKRGKRVDEAEGLGLTIFDIDDTLFRTTAQIKVVKDGQVIRSLNNQEFNTYQLKPGETFDFGEFRNAEKFNRESIPIEPMIAKLKAIINNAGDSKVIMLTARSDFDNKELFLDTFRKHGIDMSRVHVHRAGNLGGSPSQNKAVWIRKYLDTGKYARVRLYDDAMSNIRMFIGLQSEYPNIKFFPYFVTHEGSIKTIREDGRIVKGVNTTVDVGPNEIKTQAAKFGNTVTKDGVPPTMSKRVKGSSTNVLFNLGLAEDKEPRYTAREWAIIEGGHSLDDVKPQPKKPGRIFETLSEYELEDRHPNERPVGPETKPTMPPGTIRVKVSDVYDWYKLGQHISDLEGLGKHDFGEGPPEAVIAFGSEEEEHKYIELLQKLGLEILDIDPGKADAKGVKSDPTYNTENLNNKIKYKTPDFDREWEEAERYPEFRKIGKAAWVELASKGQAVTVRSAKDINNTDAADPNSFKLLDKDKQNRALAQLKSGSVEMPIVAVYPDGYKELVGGNTRLTAMMAQNGKANVWVFEVPDEITENFADGKVKGKSRPGRVKKAGASCKGSVTDLRARAKKYSGERGRMYHWCANMKSGRKKS